MTALKDSKKDFNTILANLYTKFKEEYSTLRTNNPHLIKPEMTAIMALKPFVAYLTASRRQMVGGHIASNLPLVNPTSPNIYTAYEFQFARTAYQLAAPCDMKITCISEKPAVTTIIYYDYDQHLYRSMEIPTNIITGDRFGCMLNNNRDILYP